MWRTASVLVLLACLAERGRPQVVAPGSEAQCDLMNMFAGLQRVSTDETCRAGCETGRGECPDNWTPTGVDVCASQCGKIFEPFWDVCGTYLIAAGLGGMVRLGSPVPRPHSGFCARPARPTPCPFRPCPH